MSEDVIVRLEYLSLRTLKLGSCRGNEAPIVKSFSSDNSRKRKATAATQSFDIGRILFSGTALVIATLRSIGVVWSRMSGIAQSLSPRAAIHKQLLRTSTTCRKPFTIRKASRRALYDTRYSTLGQAACWPRARRKPCVTTVGLRVGP